MMSIAYDENRYDINSFAQSLISGNKLSNLGNFNPVLYREQLNRNLRILETLKQYNANSKGTLSDILVPLIDNRIEETKNSIYTLDNSLTIAQLDEINNTKKPGYGDIKNVYTALNNTIIDDYISLAKVKFGEGYVKDLENNKQKLNAISSLGVDLALMPDKTSMYDIALKYINSGILNQDEVATLLKVRRKSVDDNLTNELIKIHSANSDYYKNISEAAEAEQTAKAYVPYWGWREGIRNGLIKILGGDKKDASSIRKGISGFITAVADSFIDDIFGNLDRIAAGISYGIYEGNGIFDAISKTYSIIGAINQEQTKEAEKKFQEYGLDKVSKDIADSIGQLGGFVTGMLATPWLGVAYGAIKGIQAGGSATLEAKTAGYSDIAAIARGTIQALSEGLVEALPLEKKTVGWFLKSTASPVKNALGLLLGAAINEGIEEVVTETVNWTSDKVLFPEFDRSFRQFLKDASYQFLMGAIGGLSGGVVHTGVKASKAIEYFNPEYKAKMSLIRQIDDIIHEVSHKVVDNNITGFTKQLGNIAEVEVNFIENKKELAAEIMNSLTPSMESDIQEQQTISKNNIMEYIYSQKKLDDKTKNDLFRLYLLSEKIYDGKFSDKENNEFIDILKNNNNVTDFLVDKGLLVAVGSASMAESAIEQAEQVALGGKYKINININRLVFLDALRNSYQRRFDTDISTTLSHELSHVLINNMSVNDMKKLFDGLLSGDDKSSVFETIYHLSQVYGIDYESAVNIIESGMIWEDINNYYATNRSLAIDISKTRNILSDLIIDKVIVPLVKHSKNIIRNQQLFGINSPLELLINRENNLLKDRVDYVNDEITMSFIEADEHLNKLINRTEKIYVVSDEVEERNVSGRERLRDLQSTITGKKTISVRKVDISKSYSAAKTFLEYISKTRNIDKLYERDSGLIRKIRLANEIYERVSNAQKFAGKITNYKKYGKRIAQKLIKPTLSRTNNLISEISKRVERLDQKGLPTEDIQNLYNAIKVVSNAISIMYETKDVSEIGQAYDSFKEVFQTLSTCINEIHKKLVIDDVAKLVTPLEENTFIYNLHVIGEIVSSIYKSDLFNKDSIFNIYEKHNGIEDKISDIILDISQKIDSIITKIPEITSTFQQLRDIRNRVIRLQHNASLALEGVANKFTENLSSVTDVMYGIGDYIVLNRDGESNEYDALCIINAIKKYKDKLYVFGNDSEVFINILEEYENNKNNQDYSAVSTIVKYYDDLISNKTVISIQPLYDTVVHILEKENKQSAENILSELSDEIEKANKLIEKFQNVAEEDNKELKVNIEQKIEKIPEPEEKIADFDEIVNPTEISRIYSLTAKLLWSIQNYNLSEFKNTEILERANNAFEKLHQLVTTNNLFKVNYDQDKINEIISGRKGTVEGRKDILELFNSLYNTIVGYVNDLFLQGDSKISPVLNNSEYGVIISILNIFSDVANYTTIQHTTEYIEKYEKLRNLMVVVRDITTGISGTKTISSRLNTIISRMNRVLNRNDVKEILRLSRLKTEQEEQGGVILTQGSELKEEKEELEEEKELGSYDTEAFRVIGDIDLRERSGKYLQHIESIESSLLYYKDKSKRIMKTPFTLSSLFYKAYSSPEKEKFNVLAIKKSIYDKALSVISAEGVSNDDRFSNVIDMYTTSSNQTFIESYKINPNNIIYETFIRTIDFLSSIDKNTSISKVKETLRNLKEFIEEINNEWMEIDKSVDKNDNIIKITPTLYVIRLIYDSMIEAIDRNPANVGDFVKKFGMRINGKLSSSFNKVLLVNKESNEKGEPIYALLYDYKDNGYDLAYNDKLASLIHFINSALWYAESYEVKNEFLSDMIVAFANVIHNENNKLFSLLENKELPDISHFYFPSAASNNGIDNSPLPYFVYLYPLKVLYDNGFIKTNSDLYTTVEKMINSAPVLFPKPKRKIKTGEVVYYDVIENIEDYNEDDENTVVEKELSTPFEVSEDPLGVILRSIEANYRKITMKNRRHILSIPILLTYIAEANVTGVKIDIYARNFDYKKATKLRDKIFDYLFITDDNNIKLYRRLADDNNKMSELLELSLTLALFDIASNDIESDEIYIETLDYYANKILTAITRNTDDNNPDVINIKKIIMNKFSRIMNRIINSDIITKVIRESDENGNTFETKVVDVNAMKYFVNEIASQLSDMILSNMEMRGETINNAVEKLNKIYGKSVFVYTIDGDDIYDLISNNKLVIKTDNKSTFNFDLVLSNLVGIVRRKEENINPDEYYHLYEYHTNPSRTLTAPIISLEDLFSLCSEVDQHVAINFLMYGEYLEDVYSVDIEEFIDTYIDKMLEYSSNIEDFIDRFVNNKDLEHSQFYVDLITLRRILDLKGRRNKNNNILLVKNPSIISISGLQVLNTLIARALVNIRDKYRNNQINEKELESYISSLYKLFIAVDNLMLNDNVKEIRDASEISSVVRKYSEPITVEYFLRDGLITGEYIKYATSQLINSEDKIDVEFSKIVNSTIDNVFSTSNVFNNYAAFVGKKKTRILSKANKLKIDLSELYDTIGSAIMAGEDLRKRKKDVNIYEYKYLEQLYKTMFDLEEYKENIVLSKEISVYNQSDVKLKTPATGFYYYIVRTLSKDEISDIYRNTFNREIPDDGITAKELYKLLTGSDFDNENDYVKQVFMDYVHKTFNNTLDADTRSELYIKVLNNGYNIGRLTSVLEKIFIEKNELFELFSREAILPGEDLKIVNSRLYDEVAKSLEAKRVLSTSLSSILASVEKVSRASWRNMYTRKKEEREKEYSENIYPELRKIRDKISKIQSDIKNKRLTIEGYTPSDQESEELNNRLNELAKLLSNRVSLSADDYEWLLNVITISPKNKKLLYHFASRLTTDAWGYAYELRPNTQFINNVYDLISRYRSGDTSVREELMDAFSKIREMLMVIRIRIKAASVAGLFLNAFHGATNEDLEAGLEENQKVVNKTRRVISKLGLESMRVVGLLSLTDRSPDSIDKVFNNIADGVSNHNNLSNVIDRLIESIEHILFGSEPTTLIHVDSNVSKLFNDLFNISSQLTDSNLVNIVDDVIKNGYASSYRDFLNRLSGVDKDNQYTFEEMLGISRIVASNTFSEVSRSDKVYAFYVNSLLSGVTTIFQNTTGITYGLLRFASQHLAGLLNSLANGKIGDYSLGDVLMRDRLLFSKLTAKYLELLWSNLRSTFNNRISAVRLRLTAKSISQLEKEKLPLLPYGSTKAGKIFWKFITLPTALAYTIDEFVKTTFGFSKALLYSVKTAHDKGLTRIEDIYDFVFDDLFYESKQDKNNWIINPNSYSWQKSIEEMNITTFINDFDNEKISQIHRTIKHRFGGRWLMPFTTVFSNLIKISARMSYPGVVFSTTLYGLPIIYHLLRKNTLSKRRKIEESIEGIRKYPEEIIPDSIEKIVSTTPPEALERIAESLLGFMVISLVSIFFGINDKSSLLTQRALGRARTLTPEGSVISKNGNEYKIMYIKRMEPFYQSLVINSTLENIYNILSDRYNNGQLSDRDIYNYVSKGFRTILYEIQDYGAFRAIHDLDILISNPTAYLPNFGANLVGGLWPNLIKQVNKLILSDYNWYTPVSGGNIKNAIASTYFSALQKERPESILMNQFGFPLPNYYGENIANRLFNISTLGFKPINYSISNKLMQSMAEVEYYQNIAGTLVGENPFYSKVNSEISYSPKELGRLMEINVRLSPLLTKERESCVGQLFFIGCRAYIDYVKNQYSDLDSYVRNNPKKFLDDLDRIHSKCSRIVTEMFKQRLAPYISEKIVSSYNKIPEKVLIDVPDYFYINPLGIEKELQLSDFIMSYAEKFRE